MSQLHRQSPLFLAWFILVALGNKYEIYILNLNTLTVHDGFIVMPLLFTTSFNSAFFHACTWKLYIALCLLSFFTLCNTLAMQSPWWSMMMVPYHPHREFSTCTPLGWVCIALVAIASTGWAKWHKHISDDLKPDSKLEGNPVCPVSSL